MHALTGKFVRRAARWLMPAALAALGAGCAPSVVLPPAPLSPTMTLPDDQPCRHTLASDQQAWQINSQQSLIAVTVRRGGALARLGHDHVVASHAIHGDAMQQDGGPGQADLHFRLERMSVDEPHLRSLQGFDTQPGPEAIAGTRNNMLTRVLQAQRYPLVVIHATWPARPSDSKQMALRLAITLHGVTRTMDAQADVSTIGDAVALDGGVRLKQSDFGIVPFSVMGGALAVNDELDVRFHIVAEPR